MAINSPSKRLNSKLWLWLTTLLISLASMQEVIAQELRLIINQHSPWVVELEVSRTNNVAFDSEIVVWIGVQECETCTPTYQAIDEVVTNTNGKIIKMIKNLPIWPGEYKVVYWSRNTWETRVAVLKSDWNGDITWNNGIPWDETTEPGGYWSGWGKQIFNENQFLVEQISWWVKIMVDNISPADDDELWMVEVGSQGEAMLGDGTVVWLEVLDLTAGTWFLPSNINTGGKGIEKVRIGKVFHTKDASWQQFPTIPLGVEDYLASSLKMYPNPTDSLVTVELPDNIHINEIRVSSLDWLTLFMIPVTTSNQIDLSSLASGAYLVNIETDQGTVSKKLIKQ